MARCARYATLSMLVVWLTASLMAQGVRPDPLVGVWVMDIAKSEWDPAFRCPIALSPFV